MNAFEPFALCGVNGGRVRGFGLRARFLAPVVLLVSLTTCLWGAPKVEHVKRGKEATALVVSSGGGRALALGSAFAVSDRGHFLTSAEVARRSGTGGKVKLILLAGEKEQVELEARVLRSDLKLGAALLQALEAPESLAGLETGGAEGLVETAEVMTFSHAPGVKVDGNKTVYPAIGVRVGRITTLSRNDGELEQVEVEQSASGSDLTGGPALGADGRVIGLLAGVSGPRVRILPANRLAAFLATPEVSFTPPGPVAWEKRFEPLAFSARVTSLVKGKTSPQLRLTLRSGEEKERVFELEPTEKKGVLAASAPPAAKREKPAGVRVTFVYPQGEVKGTLEESALTAGGRSWKAAELKEARRDGKTWLFHPRGSGEPVTVRNLKWKKLKVDLGGPTVSVNAADLVAFTVAAPEPEPDAVRYLLEARVGEAVLKSFEGVIRFDRRAASAKAGSGLPMPVGKATFEGDEIVVKWPERYASFDVGASGRYFAFHLKAAKKVAILDVLTGKTVHEIEAVPDDVILAAGGEKLVLVMPGQKMLQRWSLKTFEREQVGRIPGGESPVRALLGANATGFGPLLLGGKTAQLIDLNTLGPAKIEGKVIGGSGSYGYSVRAAADSRSFGGIPTGYGPVAFTHMRIADGKTHTRNFSSTSNAIRWAQPTADGSLLFGTTGIFTGTLQPVAASWLKDTYRYPTVDPRYFLAVKFSGEKTFAHFCSVADRRILHTLEGLGEMALRGHSNTRYSLQRSLAEGRNCFHWIPWAGVLLTMPYDGQTVHLRRMDLLAELDRAEKPYLFVNSIPPLTVKKGASFTYRVNAVSSETRKSYRLDAGPEGMVLDASGLLTWDAPKNYPDPAATVIVAATTPSGREVFHSFDLTVTD